MTIPSQISAIAATLGATQAEINLLLGIAYAESKFDPNASGDNGWSNGLFQAERTPGTSIGAQVKTALNRIREQNKSWGSMLADLSDYVSNDPMMIFRYHRAAWQTAPQMPRNWLNYLSNLVYDMKQQATQGEVTLSTAGIRESLAGSNRLLDIDDLITWAGSRNVNAAALRSGQDQFMAYFQGDEKKPTYSTAKAGILPFAVIAGLAVYWWLKNR